MKKRLHRVVCIGLTAGVLTAILGCASTIDSRIADNQTRFNNYPPEVQDNIRAGVVEPDYTKDMVQMALGEPDYRYMRETAETSEEIWVYTVSKPRFSIGIGGATGGRHTAVGTGVGVHTGGREEEAMRVRFRDGKVHAVETTVEE